MRAINQAGIPALPSSPRFGFHNHRGVRRGARRSCGGCRGIGSRSCCRRWCRCRRSSRWQRRNWSTLYRRYRRRRGCWCQRSFRSGCGLKCRHWSRCGGGRPGRHGHRSRGGRECMKGCGLQVLRWGWVYERVWVWVRALAQGWVRALTPAVGSSGGGLTTVTSTVSDELQP